MERHGQQRVYNYEDQSEWLTVDASRQMTEIQLKWFGHARI